MREMRMRSAAVILAAAVMLISAVSLALPFWSDGSDAAVPDDSGYYDMLSPDGKRIYDGLVANASSINLDEFVVSLDNVCSEDTASQAFCAFKWSNPEFFWVNNIKYTLEKNTKITITTITTLDGVPDKKSAIEDMYSQIDTAVSGFVTSGAMRYDLVKGFHDRIVNTTRYDTAAAADEDSNPNAFNIYGVLVEGKAVCQGYSMAMDYLCGIAGIPCMNVTGKGVSDSGSENHMWNYIMMDDGLWYCMDVTWDDPLVSDGSDMLRYDYYLVGADTVTSGRTFTESHIPTYSGCLSVLAGAVPKTSSAEPKKLSAEDFIIRPGSEDITVLIGDSGDGAYVLQKELIDPSSPNNILWKIGSSGKGAVRAGGLMFIFTEKDLETLAAHLTSVGADTLTFDSAVGTVSVERPLLSPIDRKMYTPSIEDGNGTAYTDLSAISSDLFVEIGIPYEKGFLDIDMLIFVWELDGDGKPVRVDTERCENGYAVAKVDTLSGYYVASNNYTQLSPILVAVIVLCAILVLIVAVRAIVSRRRRKKRKNSKKHKH
ncbi:MAG: transglutaminase domain-containing protein [Candidatus Methanomethylophilaceae archaeon]